MLSTKKRDTMNVAAAAGINPSPDSGTSGGQELRIANQSVDGTNVHPLLFIPSYRFLTPNNAEYQAYRTAKATYVKGIAETWDIIPNDSSTWWWRRVIFAYKSTFIPTRTNIGVFGAQPTAGATSARQLKDLSGVTSGGTPAVLAGIYDDLFEGVLGTDWSNPMTAKIDKRRVTLLHDSRRTIGSGNNASRPRLTRRYHPVNKTVVYDDEENGLSMTPSPFSVNNKAGLGDIYMLDFFTCPSPLVPGGAATSGASNLQLGCTQTYYWHEK